MKKILALLLIAATALYAETLKQNDLVEKIGGVSVLRDTPMKAINAFRKIYADEKDSKENIEFLNQQFADYVGFGTLEKKSGTTITYIPPAQKYRISKIAATDTQLEEFFKVFMSSTLKTKKHNITNSLSSLFTASYASIQNKSYKTADDLHILRHLLGALYLASIAEVLAESPHITDMKKIIELANLRSQSKHASFKGKLKADESFFSRSQFNPLDILKRMRQEASAKQKATVEKMTNPETTHSFNAQKGRVDNLETYRQSAATLQDYRNSPDLIYKIFDLHINNDISGDTTLLEAFAIMELNPNKKLFEVDLKKQFNKLSCKYHPDKNGGSEESKVAFQKLKAAKDLLTAAIDNIVNPCLEVPPYNLPYLYKVSKRQWIRFEEFDNMSIYEALYFLGFDPSTNPSLMQIQNKRHDIIDYNLFYKHNIDDHTAFSLYTKACDLLAKYNKYLWDDNYPI